MRRTGPRLGALYSSFHDGRDALVDDVSSFLYNPRRSNLSTNTPPRSQHVEVGRPEEHYDDQIFTSLFDDRHDGDGRCDRADCVQTVAERGL